MLETHWFCLPVGGGKLACQRCRDVYLCPGCRAGFHLDFLAKGLASLWLALCSLGARALIATVSLTWQPSLLSKLINLKWQEGGVGFKKCSLLTLVFDITAAPVMVFCRVMVEKLCWGTWAEHGFPCAPLSDPQPRVCSRGGCLLLPGFA